MVDEGNETRNVTPEPLDLDEPGEDLSPSAQAPAAAGRAPDLATLLRTGERWGYVDDEGGIHVRAGRYHQDRIVARVPPSKRAETLARLLLAFPELEDRFSALRKELRRSKNLARNLKSLRSFVRWVEGGEAIGDYDSLLGRAHAEIDRIEGRIAEIRAAKLALVERAEALADSSSWKSTGEAMDELMQEWRTVGSSGRDQDEDLWQRFSGARRAFFARRREHFADLKRSGAAKEALIARAEELAPSTDYEGTFADMQALLDEWKQAGSAGRDLDDRLWDRFRAAREPFFARRRTHIAEQRRREAERERSGDRGPRERGGPGGPRRGRGRPPGGRPQGRPRGGEPGVLRSSLADIVGDLRDLFPAERDGQRSSDGTKVRKGNDGDERDG